MPKTLVSPWINVFENLVASASVSLVICSPYIGRGPCERIAMNLFQRGATNLSVLVLTNLSRDNMLSGATDVSALADMCQALPQMRVRFLPNLHAKIYVADKHQAIVTSANMTDSGLFRNLEYGIHVDEEVLVYQIASDLAQFASLGASITLEQLRQFEAIVTELKILKEQVERSLKSSLKKEFDRKLQLVNENVLRVRAEGLSSHAAFADTILFLLRSGPKDTKTLYAEVQNIHMDLCDDTIKLVISGEEWSQVKWHHRVRHAQLYLKRQGRIERMDNKWQIVQ